MVPGMWADSPVKRSSASAKRRARDPARGDDAGPRLLPGGDEAPRPGGEAEGHRHLAGALVPRLLPHLWASAAPAGEPDERPGALGDCHRHQVEAGPGTALGSTELPSPRQESREEEAEEEADLGPALTGQIGALSHAASVDPHLKPTAAAAELLGSGSGAATPGTPTPALEDEEALAAMLARVLARGYAARRALHGGLPGRSEEELPSLGSGRPHAEGGGVLESAAPTGLCSLQEECGSSTAWSRCSSSDDSLARGGRPRSPAPAPIPNLDMSKVRLGSHSARTGGRSAAGEAPALASSRSGSRPWTPAPGRDPLGRTKETLALLSARAAGAPASPLFTMGALLTARSSRCAAEGSADAGQLFAGLRAAGTTTEESMATCNAETCVFHSARIRSTRLQSGEDPWSQMRAQLAVLSARNDNGYRGTSSSTCDNNGGASASGGSWNDESSRVRSGLAGAMRRSISDPPSARRPFCDAAEAAGGDRDLGSPLPMLSPLPKARTKSPAPEAVSASDAPQSDARGPPGDLLGRTREVLEMLSARHARPPSPSRSQRSNPALGAE